MRESQEKSQDEASSQQGFVQLQCSGHRCPRLSPSRSWVSAFTFGSVTLGAGTVPQRRKKR